MTRIFTHSHVQFLQNFFDFSRKRKYPLLEVLNAIFYVADSGCKWRNLPEYYPPFQVVHYYFTSWTADGTFDQLCQALVEESRLEAGRDPEPSACIIDSQSVKNDRFVSEHTGYDGNKKVKGRKRHIGIDTQGNLTGVRVGDANEHDGAAAVRLMEDIFSDYPKVQLVVADSAYGGRAKDFALSQGKMVEIVTRKKGEKFVVLPKRWKVEQAISNLCTCRRLSKDYEHKAINAEGWILVAEILRLLKRRFKNPDRLSEQIFQLLLSPNGHRLARKIYR